MFEKSAKFISLLLNIFLPNLHFPVNSIVSLLYTMENGSTAEMGMVGRCGVVSVQISQRENDGKSGNCLSGGQCAQNKI